MKMPFLTVLLAVSAGCGSPNLYVAHDTVVGLNAKVSADRQQGQLLLGYDRDFATVVPTGVEGTDGSRDAMALLSCSELEVEGIHLTQYTDVTASGEAARTFATSLNSGENVFDCNPVGGQT
ncbi:MAG TPA: hypothetical protein DEB47_22380 [Citreicella sp.]|mgnify:CR=1 FL=1|nr:hypothetical protein [Citreicella sp.]|tara:strand:- start:367 stop:732 length:366 start_codon:yes stop_codon:yes gene_type:complete